MDSVYSAGRCLTVYALLYTVLYSRAEQSQAPVRKTACLPTDLPRLVTVACIIIIKIKIHHISFCLDFIGRHRKSIVAGATLSELLAAQSGPSCCLHGNRIIDPNYSIKCLEESAIERVDGKEGGDLGLRVDLGFGGKLLQVGEWVR